MKTSRRGQSLVETALVMPLVILILTGIIDFGLLFNNYLVISNASREGVRMAVVGATDAQITTSITNMTSTLDPANMNVIISPVQGSRNTGEEVTVTVGYNNPMLTPIISAMMPNPAHIESKTVMRME